MLRFNCLLNSPLQRHCSIWVLSWFFLSSRTISGATGTIQDGRQTTGIPSGSALENEQFQGRMKGIEGNGPASDFGGRPVCRGHSGNLNRNPSMRARVGPHSMAPSRQQPIRSGTEVTSTGRRSVPPLGIPRFLSPFTPALRRCLTVSSAGLRLGPGNSDRALPKPASRTGRFRAPTPSGITSAGSFRSGS
jgi:hypothetical protein